MRAKMYFRWGLAACCVLALAACEDGPKLGLGQGNGKAASAPRTESAGKVVAEREREAPEIFSREESALWDGRPSLGGIWVAHPDVDDPQRVMMRNLDNGKFVIGALFRRERDLPGPQLQVSSDAATELGMLAGAPVKLSVVALIREAVEVEPEIPADAGTDSIETKTLDPVADLAAKAIDAAERPKTKPVARPSANTKTASEPSEPAPAAPAKTEPQPTAAPAPTTTEASQDDALKADAALTRPYVQVGIFSTEDNANTAADALRAAGVIPTIRTFTSQGKSFWRVVAGPVSTAADRRALLQKLEGLGFADAYPVKN